MAYNSQCGSNACWQCQISSNFCSTQLPILSFGKQWRWSKLYKVCTLSSCMYQSMWLSNLRLLRDRYRLKQILYSRHNVVENTVWYYSVESVATLRFPEREQHLHEKQKKKIELASWHSKSGPLAHHCSRIICSEFSEKVNYVQTKSSGILSYKYNPSRSGWNGMDCQTLTD